jgi:hypothetical protein
MERTVSVLEKVRDLIASLSAEERLDLIRDIAAMETFDRPAQDRHHNHLTAEQAAWSAKPPEERKPYRGEFVAVREGQVVDHDADQRTLYLRVRARFGHTPVLIVPAEWTELPVYTIHSPRLEHC